MFCDKKSMKEVNKMQLYLLLMQTFFTFIYIQFMFNSRLMTNKYKSSYAELLDLTSVISPHQHCLSSLMTEACKCLNGHLPDIINDVQF